MTALPLPSRLGAPATRTPVWHILADTTILAPTTATGRCVGREPAGEDESAHRQAAETEAPLLTYWVAG